AWVRQDRVAYYPSADVFQDQPATLAQTRRLTNSGFKVDINYTKGIHNVKGGFVFNDTPLSEYFQTGITDPLANALCVDANGVPVVGTGVNEPGNCASSGYTANLGFSSGLLPFDLTRGGQLFTFRGSTAIKQEGVYVQDSITVHNFNIQLGLRADNYDGLSSRTGIQPRTGVSYQIKKTGTVFRASYGRIFLTPYNENLILSSSTGIGGLESAEGGGAVSLIPARRNHFETGFQQAFDGWLVVDASYFWKFTDDDFDFDVFLNTPLAFPIQWRKSKIDGFSIRVSMPEHHGLSAYSVMGHTRARFFEPEVGGLIFNSPVTDEPVFRIDHDQAFQQNTHIQYQPTKRSPWLAFTWSYESGEVAGAVPDFATLLTLTGDQQQQAGLFCGSTFATVASPIRTCNGNIGSTRLTIPPVGTYDADKNPSRVAPRNLFDAAIGWDNIFNKDRYKVNLRFTAVNVTNEDVLYNLLSTFSGTHFVTPRSYKAEIGMDF
ncbi:MAG TPA: TonB-dependent receptor, partial [Terriglobales bacterium]|nr:TonB-dependent receptor [Terriglobales bacterium]